MNSQGNTGSNFMFQSINDELDASLAAADQLSREFSSMISIATPAVETTTAQSSVFKAQTSSSNGNGNGNGNGSLYSASRNENESLKKSFSQSPTSSLSSDPTISRKDTNLDLPVVTARASSPLPGLDNMKYRPSSPSPYTQHHPTFTTRKDSSESWHSFEQNTSPNMSPNSPRRLTQAPLRPQDRSTRGSSGSFGEIPVISSPTYDNKTRNMFYPSPSPLTSIPKSPRLDRPSSIQAFSQPNTVYQQSSTLPRNFQSPRPSEEGMQRPKNASKWNESDLDASYERKPHHTYDKNEWHRPPAPNSAWKESNLDGPPSAKKETVSNLHPTSYSSLPRNTRIPVAPDPPSQPMSRISIPPVDTRNRLHRPIPLSVLMRLQHGFYPPNFRLDQEYLWPYQTPKPQQPQKQPPNYREVLYPGDVEPELERLGTYKTEGPVSVSAPSKKPEEEAKAEDSEMPPRPLSPTRLQPVVAVPAELNADFEDLMQIRAEFPRALKKRGSADVPQFLPNLPEPKPNYYKQFMNKTFRRKTRRIKEEPAAESGESSDGEDSSTPVVTIVPIPITETVSPGKRVQSILRKGSKANKSSSRRAHLSPLVLMLDGALVGELETVQRAAQKMSDPSQCNDEGITALHNAICGGHLPVVEFLVRIGANVSAPDSHGWTPLHCAASCNDRKTCEFLVRNGAAVMAVTDSDGATAAQKCDPFTPGFEECESFLRGVEEAMGVENSGVVYALWGYPAQAPDELSFKEGDMVTILQKPEGVGWWWASLCGREGFVPNNYFGLFPKVRPKSLC